MGTGEGNNSSTEETKVVMDELAKTLSEGSWVVDSVAADMEGLEGAISVGPIIQIDCGVGQAQKVKLGLVSSISNEYILTPKKPNTRKWKRTARKGSGQSALEGIPSPIQRILSARRNSKQSCDLVGLGGVIKNSDGWIGLVMAKQLGLPVALAEVDASSVVDGVNLFKPSLSVVWLVISDIQALYSEVGIQKCQAVARSSNGLAHNLAYLTISSGRDFL
ncbi:hypothetical protein ACOSQ3_024352 [Xanthoceras sorbifolium]